MTSWLWRVNSLRRADRDELTIWRVYCTTTWPCDELTGCRRGRENCAPDTSCCFPHYGKLAMFICAGVFHWTFSISFSLKPICIWHSWHWHYYYVANYGNITLVFVFFLLSNRLLTNSTTVNSSQTTTTWPCDEFTGSPLLQDYQSQLWSPHIEHLFLFLLSHQIPSLHSLISRHWSCQIRCIFHHRLQAGLCQQHSLWYPCMQSSTFAACSKHNRECHSLSIRSINQIFFIFFTLDSYTSMNLL